MARADSRRMVLTMRGWAWPRHGDAAKKSIFPAGRIEYVRRAVRENNGRRLYVGRNWRHASRLQRIDFESAGFRFHETRALVRVRLSLASRSRTSSGTEMVIGSRNTRTRVVAKTVSWIPQR